MPWKHLPAERLGIALAVLAAAGFSLKAIFVKLAYAAAPVDAITLLALRMGFTLPVVLAVLAAERRGLGALGRRDWGLLAALGLLGYYGASILDFWGLEFISAGLERGPGRGAVARRPRALPGQAGRAQPGRRGAPPGRAAGQLNRRPGGSLGAAMVS